MREKLVLATMDFSKIAEALEEIRDVVKNNDVADVLLESVIASIEQYEDAAKIPRQTHTPPNSGAVDNEVNESGKQGTHSIPSSSEQTGGSNVESEIDESGKQGTHSLPSAQITKNEGADKEVEESGKQGTHSLPSPGGASNKVANEAEKKYKSEADAKDGDPENPEKKMKHKSDADAKDGDPENPEKKMKKEDMDGEEDEAEAALTKEERDRLPDSDFALPEKRALPMHDEKHVRLAWDMVERKKGLTSEEKKRARTRILRRAREMGIDVSGWKKQEASYEFANLFIDWYLTQERAEKAEAALVNITKSVTAYKRMAELVSAGLEFSAERRAKVIAKITNMTDEQFDDYKAELLEAKNAAARNADVRFEKASKGTLVLERKTESSSPYDKLMRIWNKAEVKPANHNSL